MITLATPQGQPMRGPQYRPQGAPPPPREPGVAEQFGNMAKQRAMEGALNAGETAVVDGAKAGYGKLAGMMATPAAPSAAQMSGLTELATASGGGLSPGAAQAVLGSGQAAAPLVGQAAGMTGAQLAGTTGAQLATSAGTSAATAGAGAGMAALGTAVPYIGAGLLAGKALGFFSQGGFVGPLAKVEYKSHGGDTYKLSYGGPISKGA